MTHPIRPFIVTHHLVFTLAAPMTLAYLTTPLLGVVDTAVVGRLGEAFMIGGLAVGAILVDVIFTTFNFLRSGTTGLTAQAYGREDETEIQATLLRSLIIGVASGIILLMLTPLLLSLGLYLMEPSETVAIATQQYVLIRMLGAPVTLGNYALLGWFIGLGRTRTGLLLQIALNGSNIILSIFLGLHLSLGIKGVAAATVISELLAFLLGLLICYPSLKCSTRPSWQRLLDRAALWRFANLNLDIMLRSFALLFAFAFFTTQGAYLGEQTLAANAVLMNFFMLASYFLDGLTSAAEQLAGRAIGANYRDGFMRSLKLTLGWNTVMASLLAMMLWFLGEPMIALITTLESVQTEAAQYLLLVALLPLTGVLAFQMDGIFIGATWSRDMSLMMLVSLGVYLATWWWLRDLANNGLWLALHVFLLVRGLTLSARLPVRIRQTFSQTK
ncbi:MULTISPECIES: MATE family efflux transporter [Nitrosomonas]|uniref:Putative MATE family efflux protein n=1 Tax=Nitrosomonas communis TaxID=44574 RepID=A0A0F7KIC2_9PROT|nr:MULTISPECIES: MATE family efflux transporter [Nitrosomonas]AKH38873.1 XRE family transcriptional regulator [Nitrosomonas communis]TYP91916.1 putative MATE family efflux protein [Nitrosomonas communis]UVS61003.1 MATE family efflux transporter [Nitrosomonas sp. PLL12]